MARSRSTFGSVETLPSGRFRARYATGPASWRSAPTTFTTKGEALAWLARERVRLEQEAAGSPVAVARRTAPILRDYATTWLDERRLRPSTRVTYAGYIRRHIAPTSLGGKRLDAITPDDVRTWWRTVNQGHPTGRARVYAVLKTMMKTAVDDDLIDRNPCRIVGAAQTTPTTEVVTLDPGQVAALAAEMGPDFAAAIHLGAWCQLRVGEVLALRRRDVDLNARTVHVRRGLTWVNGGPLFGPPKTAAGVRTVSIPRPALDALRTHLSTIARGADSLLFVGSTEGRPPSPQAFSDRVHRAAVRAGLPPGFRFHHLRHTGLTLLAESGASVAELQSRAGHTTPSMALRYQHARAERDRDLADRLAELVEKGLT